jgi:putative ATP-binding cassette transporter
LNANIFYWGAGAVSYIIPGFILGKETDVDTFVAAATMISLILYQLAYLIQLSQEFSKLLASSDRVMELFVVLDDIVSSSPSLDKKNELHLHKSISAVNGNSSNKQSQESDSIVFDNVILITPAGRILFPHGISFKVQPRGQCNILIMGPSGVGKSSLVRCLGDLWPVHSGKIIKPSCGIFHVPQRPYLMYGTLRAQLAYPSDPKLLSDSEAEFLLSTVRLPCLLGDLDKVCSWSQILSLGEQQLLVIGRLLFHKPSFVILDECTSAMDEDIEQEIYRLVIKTGAGILSIAHRSTLLPFHHKLIKVDKDGNYVMEPILNNVYNEI